MVLTRRKMSAQALSISVLALTVAVPSANAQPSNTTISGDGVYLVGTDIQPGTYVSDSPGYCSWYRLSSISGESNNIIDSDNSASGKQYVTIKPTDVAFKTLSCSTWRLVSSQSTQSSAAQSNTIPGDGVYLVGSTDIQPGTYVSDSPGYCSWYRLSSISGESNNIIDSDNSASGKQYVTIKPTDVAFKTLSCSTWSLVSR